jgi:hypothetical protein
MSVYKHQVSTKPGAVPTESLSELTTVDAIASFAAEIGVSPEVAFARPQTDETISRETGNRTKKLYGF